MNSAHDQIIKEGEKLLAHLLLGDWSYKRHAELLLQEKQLRTQYLACINELHDENLFTKNMFKGYTESLTKDKECSPFTQPSTLVSPTNPTQG